MNPWLHDATYQKRVRCPTGFTDCVHSGRYDHGNQVAIGTVSGEPLAIVMTVTLAYEGNPTKAQGKEILVPRLTQMMEGWREEDPPTKKIYQ